jgi:uncharacterized phage protein (TIGR01671 family)
MAARTRRVKMSNLKFRAWDKKSLKMRTVVGLDFTVAGNSSANGIKFVRCLTGTYRAGSSVEVMQYTGLKDKNGQEIYEGDIVNWDAQEYQPAGQVVVAYPGGFILSDFDGLDDERTGGSMWVNRKSIEQDHTVIGNIYENPGLLEVSHEK